MLDILDHHGNGGIRGEAPYTTTHINGYENSTYVYRLKETNTTTKKGRVKNGTPGKEGTTTVSGTRIKTYTAKMSNSTYILYKQTEGPWAGRQYMSYGTVARVGCPTTAMATAVSSFSKGVKLTPNDFTDQMNSTGGVVYALRNLGFPCTYHGSIDRSAIIKELKAGYPVIYHVGSSSIFTYSEHWMALIDISSDGKKIYVASGASGSGAGWYSTDTAFYGAIDYITLDH